MSGFERGAYRSRSRQELAVLLQELLDPYRSDRLPPGEAFF